MAKKRVPIPAAIQARVQFESDRTCCICRQPGKPFQIHHIDENPANNDPKNLAVLCRDHHDETMIRGTFNRRLSADVVILYRDDWLSVVAQRRIDERGGENMLSTTSAIDFANVVEKLELLKERKEYGFLAAEYDHLGNTTLRDKYIDLAIENGASDFTTIFLRGMQKNTTEIPDETLERVIKRYTDGEQWEQLGRVYDTIGDYKNAVINYCKGIIDSFDEENAFSGAFYLKELSEMALHVPIFQETYEQYESEGDLWWALRSLQELEWWNEARNLLLRNEEKILASDDDLLKKELYSVKGDVEAYRELELREAATITADPESGAVGFSLKPPNDDSLK